MKGKDTITGGLGIPDDFCQIAEQTIDESMSNNETVSDAIIEAIKKIREDEFGECHVNLSPYEKKLFFAGFVLGVRKVHVEIENAKQKVLGGIMGDILSLLDKKDGEPEE